MKSTSTVIIGCGDIGRRVAELCLRSGQTVTGVVRSSGSQLRAVGANAIECDLDAISPAFALPANSADLYIFAPPPAEGETDPRIGRLLSSLAQTRPRKIVYISTPSVYGDCGGRWIDENQALAPQSSRGRRRADAEQQLQRWCQAQQLPLTILRVPGIYGPGRLPVKRLQSGAPMVRAEESPYTNRIHADDLAAICVAAMQAEPSGVFHASDGQPTKMTEYFDRCAAALNLPPPRKITLAEAQTELSPGLLGYLRESRRMKNQRLQQLGVTLQYPNLDAGLADCVRHYLANRTLNAVGRG